MKNKWMKLIRWLVAIVAALCLGGWLLSKAPWIGRTKGLARILQGVWLLAWGVHIFRGEKEGRTGRRIFEIGWVCGGVSLMLRLGVLLAA